MEHASTSIDPEEVLAQRAWIRRIARELIGDASAADDLAQDAWLAARDGPPRPGARAPWLRGVLRRLAAQRQREEARRGRRERSGARPEATPATDELVQRAELQRRIAAAVVALPEPYRTTVLLRYFDELSAAEIARRLGLPAATVRSRLARGLAQLRSELDGERPEGRAAWAPLLASWLSECPLPAATAITILGGVLAMKVLAISVAAVMAAIGLWWVWSAFDQERPVAALSAHERTHAASPAEAVEPRANEPASARTALEEVASAPAPPASEPLAPETAPVPPTRAFAEARLVDERGRALAAGSLSVSALDARASANAAGFARLELELPLDTQSALISARAPGHAAQHVHTQLTRGATVQLGELVLAAAGGISGRVVDGAGAPLAGIAVLAGPATAETFSPGMLRRLGPRDASLLPGDVSASDGSFHIASVPAGAARAWAGGGSFAWSSVGPLEVVAGSAIAELELVVHELEDDEVIAGIVLEPDGRPMPRAKVQYQFTSAGYSRSASLWSDAEGRFELLLSHRVTHEFRVSDAEARFSDVFAFDVEPGTRGLELRFAEARWIEVRAKDSGGGEIVELIVYAQQRVRGYAETVGHPAAGDPLSGVARLQVPALPFEVVVDARGYALETLGPFDPLDAPRELVATLSELPGLSGRVLADGEPVAGARVLLEEVLPLDRRYLVDGFRSLVEVERRPAAESDAVGRFHIDLRRDGEYMLRAEADGRVAAELGPLALEAARGAQGLELSFPQGGAIEGRLILPDGAEPAGRVVGINHGDGRPRTLRLGEDGRYRFEGLAPGMWQVLLCEEERLPERHTVQVSAGLRSEPLEWSCEVFAGETTWYDLREAGDAHVLAGRFALGDAPLEGWSARLAPSDTSDSSVVPRVVELARDGSFRLASGRAGKHALTLRAPAGERGGIELRAEVELREGENSWQVELRAGSLSGDCGAGPERVLEYRWRAEATPTLEATARLVPDANGRFGLTLVPVGEARIYVDEPGGSDPGAPRHWTERATTRVEAGRSAHVQVP